MHSDAGQVSFRAHIPETSHDVKLNRIDVFRREADESHGYAVRRLLAHDPPHHVQRSTKFRDLEFQPYFVSYL